MRRLFLALLIWCAAAPTAASAQGAQGGFGFQGDLAVTYSLFKNFLVEVGYPLLDGRPGQGQEVHRPRRGRPPDEQFQDVRITRSGPFFGLQARW